MTIIAECDFCEFVRRTPNATYTKPTELYDSIEGMEDVMMCHRCGYAAQFERDRIIKLLESKLCWCAGQPLDVDKNDAEELMKHMNCDWQAMMIEYHVALIKGEQK